MEGTAEDTSPDVGVSKNATGVHIRERAWLKPECDASSIIIVSER